MFLEIRLALFFKTKVHHHCGQELQGEIGEFAAFVFEYFKDHGDDAQTDHLLSRTFGERQSL